MYLGYNFNFKDIFFDIYFLLYSSFLKILETEHYLIIYM